jgi:error-prone DNA polymerase
MTVQTSASREVRDGGETTNILSHCTFSLDELRYEYPDELVPDGFTPTAYLRQETYIGAHRRFQSGIPHDVQAQIEHELELIKDLEYEPYFLTVYDIVRFARNQHILCQGRGSAANSAVCYCLGVTEVDPARGNMLFERFISKERGEPPDIDVDFEHQRREEVIQYVYRIRGHRAAIAAAVSTYRPRGALRETGKALGVDPQIVDAVAKSHQWFDGKQDLLKRFSESGLNPETPLIQAWASLASQLLGFPRHLSQHSGGFVISRGKLTRLVPVENAAMADRSVIQWDKDDLESLGVLKIDVLALGMLSAIRRTLDLVSDRRGERFEMQDIPAEDPETYEMISRADTVGVFQIESRAQMSMLPRLKPRTFYDLVIEVAIVRPGPIQGGAVHPYLQRRQGFEPVSYPSKALETALGRTLGVPIFQEQVMQVAMLAAGFTAGEADQLRRAMAAWKRKGGLEKYYDRIVNGMTERGYDKNFADGIFQQILGFGEYGFPESHAASFALLVYASSWLKRHEPEAFLAAMLNSQPMGFYSPSQLVQDAKRHGVQVLPVDVTISGWDSSLEQIDTAGKPAVRLGLSLLRGMRDGAAERIENSRAVRQFRERVFRVQVCQTEAGTQMLFRVGRQVVATLVHRPAHTDCGHRVLQRFARAHVHHHLAKRDDRNAVAVGDIFDDSPVNIVHGTLMQNKAAPCAVGKCLLEPFELDVEHIFFRGEIRYQYRETVRHSAQVAVFRVRPRQVVGR